MTEVEVTAVGIAQVTWVTPGLACEGGGTVPPAAVAGGSWDCCAGPETHPGPGAAAGATSAAEFVGREPEWMEGWVHFGGVEGLEVVEDHLHPPHLVLHRCLEGQPCYSAASGVGAGVSAAEQLRPQTLGNLVLAALGGPQAAGGPEVDLQGDPVP